MNAIANTPLHGPALEYVVVGGGMLAIAAVYAWMLRRERPMLSVEREGLAVGARVVPFAAVQSLAYARGSLGVVLRVSTSHGLLAFAEDQLIQHADDVRRRIVSGAGLVPAEVVEVPKGLVHDPGDIYEEWRRPTVAELEAAAAGIPLPHRAWGASSSAGHSGSPSTRPSTLPGDAKEQNKKAAVGLTALLLLLAKFGKTVLLGLKYVVGGSKLGSLLPTALTMLASVWVYAQLWGWWFGAGFVTLLLLHELGHAAVIRAKGLRTSPIVFVPFVGALISIKDQFRDASVEAEMAWGGPAVGTLAASACYLAFLATGHAFWLHLAYLGFFLNIFNLLPVSPLDGGRVVAAISTWLWIVGLALAAALGFVTGHPILFVIVVLGGLRAWREWKSRRQAAVTEYYDLPGGYRAMMGAAYFGLCGYLGWMMYHSHAVSQALRATG